MSKPVKLIALAALAGMVAGCSGRPADETGGLSGLTGALRQAAASAIPGRKAAAAPAKPDAQVAAEALSVNPNPLILVKMDSQGGRAQAMAMVGQNGAMRTYMTPNKQALILQGGMVSGTRGLGNDLSAAEMAQSAALIRAGRSGQASRVMRYFTADGQERPLPLTCTVSAAQPGVMTEDCSGAGLSFANTYVVQGGRIAASRQWIGPRLGHVDITELRP